MARVLQHEIDHLDGILFLDHLTGPEKLHKLPDKETGTGRNGYGRMKILAVDVGTGTQDILLFDSSKEPENCLKMVMPSPTMLVADRIRQATKSRADVLLTGTIMGGGPSNWAAEDHLRAGGTVSATPSAASIV